ncbi:hypothetical protein [Kordia sp.]|uniref:hypothetical protein n=1 Tax=Kordia sp. TaxID=1965332 RepID=UPI003D6C55C2
MKKKSLKNLNLKKQSISNLDSGGLKGGTGPTVLTCLSCWFCPTVTCTQGDVCDIIISLADDQLCVEM